MRVREYGSIRTEGGSNGWSVEGVQTEQENGGRGKKKKVREYVRIVEDVDDELELTLNKNGERVRIIILYSVYKASSMRYRVRIEARETEAEIWACGVVGAGAKKELTMRIEAMAGAEGVRGVEHEEVILVGEPEVNVSRPEMWCAEEKMVGEHGVAVGVIDKKQVDYLCSRGLTEEQARGMLVRAKLVKVVNKVEDEEERERARNWCDKRRTEERAAVKRGVM